jgi:MFS family permease
MLLIIMIIYGVGVSSAGFSNSIIFMLVSRAIQGIGLSMFPIAFGIIREQFPRQKIAIGQGIISSMFAAGSGMYMQTYQSKISIHGLIQHFPSTISFDLIFITSTMLSVGSLILALILKHRITKMKIPNLN